MRQYVTALLSVPDKIVASDFIDVLVEVCIMVPDDSAIWVSSSLELVPNTVLADENKENFVKMLADRDQCRPGRVH